MHVIRIRVDRYVLSYSFSDEIKLSAVVCAFCQDKVTLSIRTHATETNAHIKVAFLRLFR